MVQFTSTLNCALKEWAIAVDALLSGELVLLLRKGGIREAKGQFQVQCDRVLLLPTVEHQAVADLKPPYRDRVCLHSRAEQSAPITFRGWAEITQVAALTQAEPVYRLAPFHIWTTEWAAQRLAWKPERPLQALLLRVYRLPIPVTVPYQASYGGCRSWITIDADIKTDDSVPVLSEVDYRDRENAIRAALAHA